ncbi:MAG: radical SAM protein, partial [Burkholderiales bacterium]|nr:radical SAM protein [Burkholderiales bacterium]
MSQPSGPRRPNRPIAIPVVPAPEPGQATRRAAPSALSAPAAVTEEGTLLALPPLSLYVHLPWCLRKCPYCDFNSHESAPPDAALQSRYRQALVRDLEAALPQVWGRTVHSIFIGGGTPSLFEPEQVEALLADIRARLRLEPACEITLEANPGTFEAQRFA